MHYSTYYFINQILCLIINIFNNLFKFLDRKNLLLKLLGFRVQIIASVAHRLVVERSYIIKTLIYASLQIVH